MGEILSIFTPPPRHSPSNTPAFSSVRSSFSKTDCILKCSASLWLATLLKRKRDACATFFAAGKTWHQLHRFINRFRTDIERRTKTDRVLPRAKRQHTE